MRILGMALCPVYRFWSGSSLRLIVHVQRLLQFGCDLLEEGDLLQEVVLHLGLEVPYSGVVEVLDLGQGGAGNDVAALVDVVRRRDVFLLLTLLCFG